MKKILYLIIALMLFNMLSLSIIYGKEDSKLRNFENAFDEKNKKVKKIEEVENNKEDCSCYYENNCKSSCRDTDYYKNNCNCTSDNLFTELFTELVWYGITSPFWAPSVMIGIDQELNNHFDLNISYRNHYLSNHTKGHTINTISRYKYLALEMGMSTYEEYIENKKEYLYFNEALLTFNFARNHNWDFRSGFGWQEIKGEKDYDAFKMVYKVDYLDSSNIYINSCYLDLGLSLLEEKTMTELGVGIGYFFENSNFNFGYRRIKIQDQTLKGPEIGLEFSF